MLSKKKIGWVGASQINKGCVEETNERSRKQKAPRRCHHISWLCLRSMSATYCPATYAVPLRGHLPSSKAASRLRISPSHSFVSVTASASKTNSAVPVNLSPTVVMFKVSGALGRRTSLTSVSPNQYSYLSEMTRPRTKLRPLLTRGSPRWTIPGFGDYPSSLFPRLLHPPSPSRAQGLPWARYPLASKGKALTGCKRQRPPPPPFPADVNTRFLPLALRLKAYIQCAAGVKTTTLRIDRVPLLLWRRLWIRERTGP